MKSNRRSHMVLSLALILVLFLPGCKFLDWVRDKFGGGARPVTQVATNNTQGQAKGMAQEMETSIFVPDDGSKVLASMNGRPLMTEKKLAQELKALGDANQEVKMMLALYGEDEIKRGLVQRKVASAVYQRFLQEQGVDQSKEYQDELTRLMEAVKDQFNQMYFLKTIPVTISEKDKRDWYEQNKDKVPDLKISEGGTKAMGVLFDTEDKAKAFMSKAKEAKGDLKKAAQLSDLAPDMVKDFHLVNAESLGVEEPVKQAIIKMKSFPVTEMVKTDKGFWVVAATAKEKTSYRPYEQIANEIGQQLDRIKRQEAAEKKLNELRESFNVVISPELEKAPEPMQPKGMEMAAQEPEDMPQVARSA